MGGGGRQGTPKMGGGGHLKTVGDPKPLGETQSHGGTPNLGGGGTHNYGVGTLGVETPKALRG